MFLEISQNSQESTCARVSFLINVFIKHLWWLLLKAATVKILSSVYVVKTCFVKMFFTPCDNWKTLFFIKVYRCRGDLFNRYVFVLFEKNGFKEVRILISTKECSGNIKMINSKIKFKNKCLVYHTSYIFCTTFNFWCSTFFYLSETFLKTQNLSESMFFLTWLFLFL